MIKHFFPATLGLFILSVPSFTHADLEMKVSLVESKVRDSSTSNARKTYGAKLADASPNIDGFGFYVSADVLYFKMIQDSNAYAYAYASIPLSGSVQPGNRTLYKSDFDFDWGFKTGFGYYAEHDQWQTGFEFTFFKTQTGSSAYPSSGQSITISPNATQNIMGIVIGASQASDNWKVSFYNLDWTIGKDFFVSKYLSLFPEVGVKTAWLWQQRNTSWTISPVTSSVSAQDDFVGVGPKCDVVAKLWLGKNFSFIGKIDTALLCSSSKVSYSAIGDSAGAAVPFSNSTRVKQVCPYIGMNLGFAYDTNFQEDILNIGIKLTYEQQYYNKASRFFNNDVPSSSDVTVQGINLGFLLSF